VNVAIPLFNGFRFTAQEHEADLRAQAVQKEYEDLRNRIVRDVRAAWLNANTAYNRLAVSQQCLQQANQALDLSQTRYKLGLGSMVELNQAQLQQPRQKSATCRPDTTIAWRWCASLPDQRPVMPTSNDMGHRP